MALVSASLSVTSLSDCVTRIRHYEKPMEADANESHSERVGQVLFDERNGRLIVGGQDVEIDRSSRAILAMLLASGGTVIDKTDLLQAGWPGRKVHENSLTKAIARLRRALGDEGWRIEAVYGHGYRLVTDAAGETGTSSNWPAPWRRRGFIIASVAMATAACAAIASHIYWAESGERPLKIAEASDVMGRILWVDDHPENNIAEKRFLEEQRMAVYNVTSSEDALKLLAMYHYDAVVSDMGRNGNPLAGLDLVKAMRARGDHTPFYLYTILPSRAQRDLLDQHGGQGVAVTSEGLYGFLLPGRGER